MAADENNNLTPEQEASIQAIADRVKNLDAEQMAKLEKLMEDNPDSIDFESMIDEIEKTGNDSLSNQENKAKQEEGRDTREEKNELPTEDGSSDDPDNEQDEKENLEKTIAYSSVDMPKDAEENALEAGETAESGQGNDAIRDGRDEPEKRDEAADVDDGGEVVEEDDTADEIAETAETAGEPTGEIEKPNEEENITVEDVEKIRKARRRSKRSLRIACLIIAVSLIIITASVASIIMMFGADHFVPAASVAIEDSEFGVSEDDLSMLSAEGYDGTELTDDVAKFMEAFFTFDKASVKDESWQESFEDLIAAEDLVSIKENMLYTRLSEGWEKVFEDHPYYKSKWVSNNSISWNILPTSTVNVPYCDVYATIDCSPLDVYFLNSPSLEINRYVNCYRIVFDSDGKITSIKKLRTVQKQASVDRDAMRSDAENAEKTLEIQRRKAEQLAREKAAAEAVERARQEAEEEAKKKKTEEEAKAKEEADKKKEEENKNENTNTGNSNSNTNTSGNTNTNGNENANTGGNTNTGGNANTNNNEPAPSEPANQESQSKQQQLPEQQ